MGRVQNWTVAPVFMRGSGCVGPLVEATRHPMEGTTPPVERIESGRGCVGGWGGSADAPGAGDARRSRGTAPVARSATGGGAPDHNRPMERGRACSRRPARRAPRPCHRRTAALLRFLRFIAEIVHEVGPHRAGASASSRPVLCALDDFTHADSLSSAHFFQGVPEFRLPAHTGSTPSDHDVAGDQSTV